jgi:hypothetical protein
MTQDFTISSLRDANKCIAATKPVCERGLAEKKKQIGKFDGLILIIEPLEIGYPVSPFLFEVSVLLFRPSSQKKPPR